MTIQQPINSTPESNQLLIESVAALALEMKKLQQELAELRQQESGSLRPPEPTYASDLVTGLVGGAVSIIGGVVNLAGGVISSALPLVTGTVSVLSGTINDLVGLANKGTAVVANEVIPASLTTTQTSLDVASQVTVKTLSTACSPLDAAINNLTRAMSPRA